MEWHEYDRTTRRDRALFRVHREQFAFSDHADILKIQMIDPLNGYIILKTRRRRAFFSQRILPDATHLFTLRKNKTPVPTHTPSIWCEDLAAKLTLDAPLRCVE
jgi:hypothetical protein